jgi:hypothetical protein
MAALAIARQRVRKSVNIAQLSPRRLFVVLKVVADAIPPVACDRGPARKFAKYDWRSEPDTGLDVRQPGQTD